MPLTGQTWSSGPVAAPWSTTATLARTDPTGLAALALALTTTLRTSAVLRSTEPGTATTTVRAITSVLRPDGTTLLPAGLSTSLTLSSVPGEASTAAGSTTGTTSLGVQPGAGQDATLLLGTGSVALTVGATAQSRIVMPGNASLHLETTLEAALATQPTPSATLATALADPVAPAAFGSILFLGAARTATQSRTLANAATGTTTTLTIDGFDPALGRLLGVELSLETAASGAFYAENLTAGPATVSAVETATTSLRLAGAALISDDATLAATRTLAAFDGTSDFTGPSGANFGPASAPSTTTAFTLVAGLDRFAAAGPITLQATRAGTATIDGPANLDVATTLAASATATLAYVYTPWDVRYTNVTAGLNGMDVGQAYTGPVALLQRQYIWSSPDSVAIAASVPNAFLKGNAGGDALASLGGTNVLDGGPGSNFLVGSTGADGGTDTFFVDGRSSATTWSTVVNFHRGDQATIFGFTPGLSTRPWTASAGATGYEGATIHSELGGPGTGITASFTFAGLDLATANRLTITDGVLARGTSGEVGYLLIQYL